MFQNNVIFLTKVAWTLNKRDERASCLDSPEAECVERKKTIKRAGGLIVTISG